MANTTVWLSQVQFLVSLGFMSLFLLIELGLAWILLFFKLAHHRTEGNAWMQAYRFWVRVYALAAILALAGAVPVLIQLGSLWPGLFERIGDVSGPLLAAAMLTAFIVKSCFMSAMLFGQRRLTEVAHTAVVFMVASGTLLSIFWALALVGWMQTPTGTGFLNGEYYVVDWYQVVFNPSSVWLLVLFLAAAALTVAFLLLGVIARRASSLPADHSGRNVFQTGALVGLAAVLLYVVAITGYGGVVVAHQPAKAAATAAYWQTGSQPDLALLGWPLESRAETLGMISWTKAGDRWLAQDAQGDLLGLDRFSGMHPPVAFTFWTFRLSLLVALAMALAALGAFWCLRRKYIEHGDLPAVWRRVFSSLTFLGWVSGLALLSHVLMGLAPFVVNQTITFLEVAGAAQPRQLAISIAAHLCVYALLLQGFFQLLRHSMQYGVVPVARRRGRA
ncbi:MAG TPA: cytochrome ubiquinol oxidase subunit I [Pusillimonas sp.]|uniref:cytochrome ubiquinol oxidase subunit I n=1 Tax=Pusillimonas sp. TaxID=3040095 RepID=UPI002C5BC2FE|nr:cytochrome ubiquinol oxidase subunit I [Pusillimonas sp.]HUH88096.1 cytochrome ubiquinol oxidase subunit I [Pusillimonas sp.]